MLFNVVSANIRFANPADGQYDWVYRKNLMASLIQEFGTDLLGTQEGRQPQLRELKELLPNMEMADQHRNWIEERMYPCIFFNPKTISIKESGDIWLSETPFEAGSSSFKSAFPRLCTWVKGTFKSSQKNFFLINTHLDHVLTETRQEQIKVLLSETPKLNTANDPVILIGDFNESPKDQVRKIINSQAPQLIDPWQALGKEEDISFHKFKGELDEASRIDWILADKKMTPLSIELNKTHENGIYPSDHFPVMAKLEI